MHRMKRAVLAALVLTFGAAGARALEINVTVDSSSIPNGTAGFLDFQFSAGAPDAQTAQVVVKNFASSALTLGGITYTNSASGGPLPANVTILNDPSKLTNQAKQSVTYGTSRTMSFTLEFTGNALTTPSTAASTFYFNLRNSSDASIFPGYGIPHLAITFPASGSGVPVISSIPLIVPEPGSAALGMMATVILALVLRSKSRKSRCRSLAA